MWWLIKYIDEERGEGQKGRKRGLRRGLKGKVVTPCATSCVRNKCGGLGVGGRSSTLAKQTSLSVGRGNNQFFSRFSFALLCCFSSTKVMSVAKVLQPRGAGACRAQRAAPEPPYKAPICGWRLGVSSAGKKLASACLRRPTARLILLPKHQSRSAAAIA